MNLLCFCDDVTAKGGWNDPTPIFPQLSLLNFVSLKS
jgi:hypothetical protein